MTLSKLTFKVLCLFFVTYLFSSCSNDDDSNSPNQVTEEEAVALIESSLKESTGGLNETTKTYSEALVTDITLNETCNTLYEDTFPFHYNGSHVQAEYMVNWSYQLTCNNADVPQSVVFESNANGSYSTSRIDSQDETITSVSISGLQPSASTLIFNGFFERDGSQILITNSITRSLTSQLNVTLTDLIVDKTNYTINAGLGTVLIKGTYQGNTFQFEGTIAFNGNGIATLTINGNSYEIDLN